ncbi:MAG: 4-phosphoerythronate dehydrogenase PdxB [Lentisphaerae bacterium]|nr:4-phosphoerythronate dehydrogenase PdxB [Lentisphaerota bacterium]
MKIVCATNMPYAREAFTTLGDVKVIEGRRISADDVRDADILAIRSTTDVNRQLLEGSRVKFVGTATIGIDHLDIDYMEKNGIAWCYSPGCNANSVSEYVTAALLFLADRYNLVLAGKTIGVIGVGNVGRRVVEKAQALGLHVLQNDPPRQRTEGGNQFVNLETVLKESDILTLHVPLTNDGQDPTRHMVDASFLEKAKNGCILINAARGAVVDTNALIGALGNGKISHTIIDTWEGEPQYRSDLLEVADIGTPHIAGHSFEGKVAGTVMVFRAACKFIGTDSEWSPDNLLPEPLVPKLTINVSSYKRREQLLHALVKAVYDIKADDSRFRAGNEEFDSLRRNYPIRREFRYTEVAVAGASSELRATIAGLGFKTNKDTT